MPRPTSHRPDPTSRSLIALDPLPRLLARIKSELAASFPPGRPLRVSRVPGRLNVMGGLSDYAGALQCETTIDRAAAMALQARDDRQLQIFSFNLFDQHKPFTAVVPLDALTLPLDRLRQEFAEGGRQWAAQAAGCLAVLHDEQWIDLKNPAIAGANLAMLSEIPHGVGLGASAAMTAAAMVNLLDHFSDLLTPQGRTLDATAIALLCHRVDKQLAGGSAGIATYLAVIAGSAGAMERIGTQPHELQGPLFLPAGVRLIGIDSGIRRTPVGVVQYARTRAAAAMGHKIILETIRKMGASAGRELIGDPMNGYLANLPLNDYKKYFRSAIPETIKGGQFLLQYGAPVDKSAAIEPDVMYAAQSATDHHVFDANRVREFVRYIEEAQSIPTTDSKAHAMHGVGFDAQSHNRTLALNKAGHLMYASHISYTRDAKLGADVCDMLVDLVRACESYGLYGAKITGAGSGGTVVVLCNESAQADAAIAEIVQLYKSQTGNKPETFATTAAGGWQAGSESITP